MLSVGLLQVISSLNVNRTRDMISAYIFAVCHCCVALYRAWICSPVSCFLLGAGLCGLCVYLLSLRLYLFRVPLLQVVGALDVCFDVSRTRCAALYVGQYV